MTNSERHWMSPPPPTNGYPIAALRERVAALEVSGRHVTAYATDRLNAHSERLSVLDKRVQTTEAVQKRALQERRDIKSRLTEIEVAWKQASARREAWRERVTYLLAAILFGMIFTGQLTLDSAEAALTRAIALWRGIAPPGG